MVYWFRSVINLHLGIVLSLTVHWCCQLDCYCSDDNDDIDYIIYLCLYIFLAFDFCRFCMVIRFFSSTPQRPMTSDFEGLSIPDVIHYIYFPYLNS